MRDQMFAFWRDVAIAFGMLVFIVVIGVLASGCAIKKPKVDFRIAGSGTASDPFRIGGEKFVPIIEHSEIKDTAPLYNYTDGSGLTLYECNHIWVQTFDDTAHHEDRGTPLSINLLAHIERGHDKDWDEYKEGISLACLGCGAQKRQVIHTKHFKTPK